ncbi:MAG: regulatory protein RecX [Peptococcaceae bacterium]|nr:regulatory protein RecX [Candidatus Syntrophopropionicum ammoniitolerans]
MKSEMDQARLYAYKLMNYRPRSKFELRWRLEGKGYSNEVVENVIKNLVRLGYIDDEGFARYWIEKRAGKRGSYGLRQELLSKGVDRAIINKHLAKLSPEIELKAALVLGRKKVKRGRTCPDHVLAGFLQRRGFSFSVIKSVVQTLLRPSDV